MKKLLLILLCLPLLFGCGGEKKENDLTEYNIKGKIKDIIETRYDAKEAFGDLEKGDLVAKEKYKYDEDGNETEWTSYNSDGELEGKYKYKYDEDGNQTELTSYNSDGELEGKAKLKYDEDGNETEWTSYDKDGELEWKYKYKYDEDGNQTESTSYDKDGELEWKYKYKYEFDKENNWIVETTYTDDKPFSITERKIEYY
jgi:antitoxin component YwqK of YwqJK toxin-antitoxin module